MMNDSVREELRDKISPIAKTPETAFKREPIAIAQAAAFAAAPAMEAPPSPAPVRFDTAEITAKPTSPTLVEFQAKQSALPDWRLELQNAVRKRRDVNTPPAPAAPVAVAATQAVLPTNGSAALKGEVAAYSEPVPAGNPKLEGALKRIEESRRRFLGLEPEAAPAQMAEPVPTATVSGHSHAPTKSYPFYIATKNAEVLPKPVEYKPLSAPAPRPVIEDLPIIAKKELDTNKLKPLPNSSIIALNAEKIAADDLDELEITEAPLITISRAEGDFDEDAFAATAEGELDEEEIEDLAPLGMRFNAAVFDLIIGAFASLILLSPLMLSGGNWYSVAGLLAFAVTCSIVMFIYLTSAVGFFGQTLGMRIFALEVLDIEEEEYPSLHQAAVNSSVYLASLALGGLGLIPVLFNEEKRAAHDLLSGTIVVREEF
jgi:uncharacterized RDD family membrane protein YckC